MGNDSAAGLPSLLDEWQLFVGFPGQHDPYYGFW
jgi:hypothetical protein